MTAPTFVNDSLAKGLSKQSIEYLVVAARMCSDAIDDYIIEAIRAQRAGKSPAKLANQLQAGIAKLISRPGIHGRLVPGTARSFAYFYVTPEVMDDLLVFSVAIGLVNTRRKLGPHDIYPVVEITRHSVERLHQRLNTTDFGIVYFEIVTITLMALDMNLAAKQTGSRQWALPSRCGMFVAVPGETAPLTTLVTWLSYDNLSTKWSRLIADLREIPELGGFGTNQKPRLVDILSRHRWLQEPYEPHPEPSFGPGKP
jgi:hypothetical protein